MIIDYTIDALIDNIKLISSTPSTQNLYSKEKFINLANNQLFSKLVPYILSYRSDYFLVEKDIPVSSIDGKFKIPQDAIGLKIRDLFIKESKKPIPYLQIEELKTVNSLGYYIRGNEIVINKFKEIPSFNTLNLSYYRRPNYLVSTSECGKVRSVNTEDNQLLLTQFPNYSAGTKLCCVSAEPGFDLVFDDSELLSVGGFTITVEDVTGVKVGDWVAQSNCSPIPQIPVATIPLFEQMIVIKIMESMNDRQGLENAKADYEDMEKQVRMTLFPRVDSSYNKAIPDFTRGF